MLCITCFVGVPFSCCISWPSLKLTTKFQNPWSPCVRWVQGHLQGSWWEWTNLLFKKNLRETTLEAHEFPIEPVWTKANAKLKLLGFDWKLVGFVLLVLVPRFCKGFWKQNRWRGRSFQCKKHHTMHTHTKRQTIQDIQLWGKKMHPWLKWPKVSWWKNHHHGIGPSCGKLHGQSPNAKIKAS